MLTDTSRQNALLNLLGEKDLARLVASSSMRLFETHEVLETAGAPAAHAYFPLEGLLALHVPTGDVAVEVADVGGEGLIGDPEDGPDETFFSQIVAATHGCALQAPMPTLQQATRLNPAFHRAVAHYRSRLFRKTQQISACNLVHNLEQRLCRRLLRCEDANPREDVRFRQDGFAKALGVNRGRLNQALQHLEERKVIDLPRRGAVRVLDRCRLQDIACSCYQTISRIGNAA